jgi:hypothetical protein
LWEQEELWFEAAVVEKEAALLMPSLEEEEEEECRVGDTKGLARDDA